jgi:hypothetical protein
LRETKQSGKQEVIVVDNWSLLGIAHSDAQVWQLLEEAPSRPPFNADVYKILSRALAEGQLQVRRLPRPLSGLPTYSCDDRCDVP